MLPTTALQLIAQYSRNGIPGLHTAYPATSKIVPPHLNLFWEETDFLIDLDPTKWIMTVRGQLMVGAKGTPDAEMLRVEQLIAPLSDVFTPTDANMAAFLLQDDVSGDRVDYCYLKRAVSSQEITVAGVGYYGAEVFFEIKMRRQPGSQ